MFWYVWLSCEEAEAEFPAARDQSSQSSNHHITLSQSHHILAWKVWCIHFFHSFHTFWIPFSFPFPRPRSKSGNGVVRLEGSVPSSVAWPRDPCGPAPPRPSTHRSTSYLGEGEGDESTTQLACSAVELHALICSMHMRISCHKIHPYTLHRFGAQVAMSVWPLVNHIHQRVSFDRKNFWPPHMCFPRWKVPELVGKVENMLPECQTESWHVGSKSKQTLRWKAIETFLETFQFPNQLRKIESMERTQSSQILSVIEIYKHMVTFNTSCDNTTL